MTLHKVGSYGVRRRLVRPPPGSGVQRGSKCGRKNNTLHKKHFKQSTCFKLLSQINGNSINSCAFQSPQFLLGTAVVITGPGPQNSLRHGSALQKPGVARFARVSSLYCCHLISDVTHMQTNTLNVVGPTKHPNTLSL